MLFEPAIYQPDAQDYFNNNDSEQMTDGGAHTADVSMSTTTAAGQTGSALDPAMFAAHKM